MLWSLLPTISAPMPLQMAFDEILFESQKKEAGAPVLRFYVSSAPWISVGCSFRQKIQTVPPSELIRRNPHVPVCQRITGGGCVLHGRDLIFSLIARYSGTGSFSLPAGQADAENGACLSASGKGPQSPLSVFSSVRTSYAKIHEGVRMGCQLCGLDPAFYDSGSATPRGNDCFDFPVESDLAWKGRKIAGGAQKRSEGVLLHHGSISVPAGVEREALIGAVRRGLEQAFGVAIEKADLDPELYFRAERLVKDKELQTEDPN